MLYLKPISFLEVQHYFSDFQKKSKVFEMPPEEAEYLGIYLNQKLIGYFIVIGYNNEWVEINQGYLLKEARHHNLPKDCLRLLEETSKRAGYSEIRLATRSRFKSYLNFMRNMGYRPEQLIFSKVI